MKFDLSKYVTVAERIQQFWQQNPHGRILTEIVREDEGKVLFKATVYCSDGVIHATGHAEETRNSANYVNKTSMYENCESSAVGRALALAGFSVERGIASREEMQKVTQIGDTGGQVQSWSDADEDQTSDHAEVVMKSCPKCEAAGRSGMMRLRVGVKEGKYKGKRFWSCENYPTCRYFKPEESHGDKSGEMEKTQE